MGSGLEGRIGGRKVCVGLAPAGAWRPQARGMGRARAQARLLALGAERVRRPSTAARSARCCSATSCGARRRAPCRCCARPACRASSWSPAIAPTRPRRSAPRSISMPCSPTACPSDKVDAVATEQRLAPDADGRRRHQRCAGARRGRRRHRHGRQGRQRLVGGCRRRHPGRSPRSGLGRGRHRQARARHRRAEHRCGHGAVRASPWGLPRSAGSRPSPAR